MSNLRKRLITGTALAVAMAGILYGDRGLPLTPFLLACILILQFLSVRELVFLLRDAAPQHTLTTIAAMLCVITAWLNLSNADVSKFGDLAWVPSAVMVLFIVAAAFLFEMIRSDNSGRHVRRMAHAQFAIAWLGVLPCFLIAIRHLPFSKVWSPTLALAATIFVPKLGDVGAFFTGTLIGKHKMAPRLSPKKTWEGFAGGMIVAMLTAVGINEFGSEPLFKGGVLQAVLFGLLVGVAGVLGDLFESAIKRRAKAKDASASVPGFGGVLDVVDSVLFAAPAAYLFFVLA